MVYCYYEDKLMSTSNEIKISSDEFKKLEPYMPKPELDPYGNPIPWAEHDIPLLISKAKLAMENDLEYKRRLKEAEEGRKKTQEIFARQAEQAKLRRERRARERSELPEKQLRMVLEGGKRSSCPSCGGYQAANMYGHKPRCSLVETSTDLEPGLRLIAEEVRTGKIVRFSSELYDTLWKITNEGDTILGTISRLAKEAAEATDKK